MVTIGFEADALLQAAERQITMVEYARSMREPPWDGFCGLVQTSEEECMAAGVSRWTSGSGNAAYGNSPRLGNTPVSGANHSRSSSLGDVPPGSLQPRALFHAHLQGHRGSPQHHGNAAAAAAFRRPPRAARPHAHGPQQASSDSLLQRLSSQLESGQDAARRAAITEEAFKAGVRCLELHDAKAAQALLSLALTACPEDRPKARAKIAALLARCRPG